MSFSWNNDSLPINPLHFLEQQTGAGLYLLDVATNKMVWSDGVYEILDIARGQVLPSRNAIRDVIHPEDRRPLDEMDRLYSSGNAFRIEYRIITRDRRVRWVSNQGEFLMDQAGKPASVFGIFRDVTTAHHSAETVNDYRERLNTILKLQKGIPWTATRDGYLTSVPGWETVFGSSEEPLGLKILEIVHPSDQEKSREDWAAAISSGDEYVAEHRVLSQNGIYRWRRCSALPIRTSSGIIREWLGITIDIDDVKTGGAFKGANTTATGAQIRAGRSILRLSVRDLSERSGISIGVIRRLEEIDGFAFDSSDRCASATLRAQMEKLGLSFIFPDGLKPAVCPI